MATQFELQMTRDRLRRYTDPEELYALRGPERDVIAKDLATLINTQERRIAWRGFVVVVVCAFGAGVAWTLGQWATVGVICQ